MAATTFVRGSEERKMFNDLYEFCQKFWKPENNTNYWEALIKASNEFDKEHPARDPINDYSSWMIQAMMSAFIRELERVNKEYNQ